MFSVRPVSSFGFFLLGPSTSCDCVVPIIACEIFLALASIAVCSRASRAFFSSIGVSSARLAAGVPGRAE